MPDPNQQTIFITLTLKEIIVCWSGLNAIVQDSDNPTPYQVRAAELASKLLQLMMARWPHLDERHCADLFQNTRHPKRIH